MFMCLFNKTFRCVQGARHWGRMGDLSATLKGHKVERRGWGRGKKKVSKNCWELARDWEEVCLRSEGQQGEQSSQLCRGEDLREHPGNGQPDPAVNSQLRWPLETQPSQSCSSDAIREVITAETVSAGNRVRLYKTLTIHAALVRNNSDYTYSVPLQSYESGTKVFNPTQYWGITKTWLNSNQDNGGVVSGDSRKIFY